MHLLWVILACVFTGSTALGQFGSDSVMYPVSAGVSLRHGTVFSYLYGEGSTAQSGAGYTLSTWSPVYVGSATTMKIGKNYELELVGWGGGHARVYFVTAPGTVMMVENVEGFQINVLNASGSYVDFIGSGAPDSRTTVTLTVRLEVSPVARLRLPAGQSTSLRAGKVLWEVGMGNRQNGEAAPTIGMRSTSIEASVYTPAGLICESPGTDIFVVSDANGLRQVKSPKALADIRYVNARRYQIWFYEANHVTYNAGTNRYDYDDINNWFVKYTVDTPDASGLNRLRITKEVQVGGTATWVTDLYVPPGGTTWELNDWTKSENPVLRREVHTWSNAGAVETVVVSAPAGSPVITYRLIYDTSSFAPDKEVITRIDGINPSEVHGSPLPSSSLYPRLVTNFTYHQGGLNHRKIRSIKYPDGSWVRYNYYTDDERLGLLAQKREPYLDFAADPDSADTSHMRITDYDYTYDYKGVFRSLLASEVTTQPDGQYNHNVRVTVRKRQSTYPGSDAAETHEGLGITQKVRAQTNYDYANASQSQSQANKTVVKRFREDSDPVGHFTPDRIYSARYPDGTLEAHAYFRGSWTAPYWGFNYSSSGALMAEFIYRGVDPAVSGSGTLLTTLTQSGQNFDLEDIRLIANKSTRVMIVRDEKGEEHWHEEALYDGTTFVMTRGGDVGKDALGRVNARVAAYKANVLWGVHYVTEYSNSLVNTAVASETDAAGVVTSFAYDARNRVTDRTVGAVPADPVKGNAQPAVTAHIEYDADDRIISVRRGPVGSTDVTYTSYDCAGRVYQVQSQGPAGALSSQVTYSANNRTVTTTVPGQLSQVAVRYMDGQPISVTDSSGLGTYWEYAGDGSGRRMTGVTTRPNGTAGATQANFSRTDTDWLGRTVQILRPGIDYWSTSTINLTNYTYSEPLGQLAAISRSSPTASPSLLAPTYRFNYDVMGRLEYEGYDVDASGALETSSARDEVIRHDYAFEFANKNGISAWWAREATFRYPSGAAAVLDSRSWTQLTELSGSVTQRVLNENGMGVVGMHELYPNRNAKTITRKYWQTGVGNAAQGIVYNGRSSMEIAPTGETAKSTYDDRGRLTKVTGRSNLATNFGYVGDTDFVSTIKNALNYGVTNSYNGYGQATSQTLADNTICYYAYNTRGQLDHRWGSACDPVDYGYDSLGRLSTIRTFQDEGYNWTTASWPDPAGGFTTSFVFDDMTGLVTRKNYADGNSYDQYTYGRAWNLVKAERSDGTYTQKREWFYENWQNPSAPGVTDSAWRVKQEFLNTTVEYARYTYRKDGSVESVADAASTTSLLDTRTFSYDPTSGYLTQELLPAMYARSGGATPTYLSHAYEGTGSGETPGRSIGAQLGTYASPTLYFSHENTYRTDNGLVDAIYFSNETAVLRRNSYQYLANTDRPDNSKIASADGVTGFYRRNFVWDSDRDLVKSVDNLKGTLHFGYYEYAYDSRDRIVQEVRNGSVPSKFDSSTFGNRETFAYADGKQLTGTSLFKLLAAWNPSAPPAESSLTGGNRAYAFDAGANRNTSTDGTSPTKAYATDSLNQYASVGGVTYEYRLGNLRKDNTYTYTYNDRNELIQIVNSSLAVGSIQMDNTYDYAGRRVRKVVRRWNGSAWAAPETDLRFVYDGWNLIAELNGLNNNSVVRTYVWTDAESAGVRATGGQGALVAIQQGGKTYGTVYDGKGNVCGVFDCDGSALKIARRFDAFGNATIWNPDDLKSPMGFKGQYTDRETNLVYYSHRFYHPALGRFIQRDPIGEAGGLNLYGFAGNDPANQGDHLGLATVERSWTETHYYYIPGGSFHVGFSFGGGWWGNSRYDYPGGLGGLFGGGWGVSLSWGSFVYSETVKRSDSYTYSLPASAFARKRPGDDTLRAWANQQDQKLDPSANGGRLAFAYRERPEDRAYSSEQYEILREALNHKSLDELYLEEVRHLLENGAYALRDEHDDPDPHFYETIVDSRGYVWVRRRPGMGQAVEDLSGEWFTVATIVTGPKAGKTVRVQSLTAEELAALAPGQLVSNRVRSFLHGRLKLSDLTEAEKRLAIQGFEKAAQTAKSAADAAYQRARAAALRGERPPPGDLDVWRLNYKGE